MKKIVLLVAFLCVGLGYAQTYRISTVGESKQFVIEDVTNGVRERPYLNREVLADTTINGNIKIFRQLTSDDLIPIGFPKPKGHPYTAFIDGNNSDATFESAAAVDTWFKNYTGFNTAGGAASSTVEFYESTINLFNKNDTGNVTDAYITGTTGEVTNLEGWTASHYIPVEPNKEYKGLTVHASWYDSSKVFISSCSSTSYISPINAAYLRGSWQTPSLSTWMIYQSSISLPYEEFGIIVNSELKTAIEYINQPHKGKKWLPTGDSMTIQSLYFDTVKDITGLIEFTSNVGANGHGIKTFLDAVTDADIIEADIITAFIGTNDYGHGGGTLGTIDDLETDETIYGYMKKSINRILTLNSNVRLIFFTPTNRGPYASEPNGIEPNPYGLTIKNIGAAMQDVCRYYGIPCEDTGGKSGINSYNLGLMTSDNLHISGEGAERVGKIMGNFINSL